MNSKGKEQIARKTVKTIKVMLKEEKSDPIIMVDKAYLGVDGDETVVKKQLKKDMQSKNVQEVKHIDTLSLDKFGT